MLHGKWFHCLEHHPHSAAMVWPGELKSAQNKLMGTFHYFVHDKTITAPVFLPVMVHEDFKSMTFEWKSWIWQRKHMPVDSLKGVAPRLLPITGHAQPRPLLDTSARKAFWQLSRSEVEELALLKGIQTSKDRCFLCLCLLSLSASLAFALFKTSVFAWSMVQVLYQTESNSNIYINSSNTEQQHFNNNRQHSKHQQSSRTAQQQQQQLQPAWTPTQCCYGALQWVLGGCVWVMRLCVWFDVVFWFWFVRVAVSLTFDIPP